MSSLAYADKSLKLETMLSSAKSATIPAGGQSQNCTYSMPIKSIENKVIGVMYKATSDGTVNLKITFEQSYDRPSTEGTTDSGYLTSESIDSSLSDENWHLATIDTAVMLYGRFCISGESGNDGSTTMSIKVAKP